MRNLSQIELDLRKQQLFDRTKDPVPGRIVLRGMKPTKDGQARTLIMGVLIGDIGLVDPNVDEMWITDVILAPDRRFRDTGRRICGKSADQTLLFPYANEHHYDEEVDLSGKPIKKPAGKKRKKR